MSVTVQSEACPLHIVDDLLQMASQFISSVIMLHFPNPECLMFCAMQMLNKVLISFFYVHVCLRTSSVVIVD